MSVPGPLKQALLTPLASSAGWRTLKGWRSRSMLSLCYHAVLSDENPTRDGNAVSQTTFRRQLEFLGRHFQFVSLDQFSTRLDTKPSGRPPLLITFDDGYRNNLSVAAPVLLELGIPAVFFLTTGYIDTSRLLWPLEMDLRLLCSTGSSIPMPNSASDQVTIPAKPFALAQQLRRLLKAMPDQDRRSYLEIFSAATKLDPGRVDPERHTFLSWEECRRLQSLGFELGSHTVEHPILSRLCPKSLATELGASRAHMLKELGTEAASLAYPNGGPDDYNSEVIDASRQAGYSLAFAVGDRFHQPLAPHHFAIQRIIVQGGISHTEFSFIMSGWRDCLKRA